MCEQLHGMPGGPATQISLAKSALSWPTAFGLGRLHHADLALLRLSFPMILMGENSPGLCQRRRWPEPSYQISYSPAGYRCIVRVNNREYQTSNYHSSESSAKEGAALIAFNICRNFSANDGMYPTGFAHGGVIQGNPVPVGSGRHSRGSGNDHRADYRYGDTDSSGSRSGGSSPDWADGRRSDPHSRTSGGRRLVYSSSSSYDSKYSGGRRIVTRY